MNWWNILKNAKVSGKAKGKGSSFDASKIKINIDDGRCKKKLLQYIKNANQIRAEAARPFVSPSVEEIETKDDWKNLTEEQACEMIALIDENWVMENDTVLGLFKDFNFESLVNAANVLDIKVGQYTFRRYIRGSPSSDRKHLYITYGFSLTEDLNSNIGMQPTKLWESTWYIWSIIDSTNWPLPNFDWRK